MNLKEKIDYTLKHSILIRKFYITLISLTFKIIGKFLKVDEKLIIFNSLGRKYNDSPKKIYEEILKDERFKDYKFVWALDHPDEFNIPKCKKIKMDTIKYFFMTLKAKGWVSAVNIERGLKFKKRETIYLNTWHGVPMKAIGNSQKNRTDYDYSHIDLFCYSGDYEKKIYMRDFNIPEKNLLLSGMPRNDELYKIKQDDIKKIKMKLGITKNKKVILYAPTWRDSKDKGKNYKLVPPINITKWKKELGDEYVVLMRTHSYTTNLLGIEFDSFIRDYSEYSNINDLLVISDILISDYSATIFDYSILGRPVICFGYDYEEYKKSRDLYIDLEKELPSGVLRTEDEVLKKIKTLNYEIESKKTKKLREKVLEKGGDATKICVDSLYEKIKL